RRRGTDTTVSESLSRHAAAGQGADERVGGGHDRPETGGTLGATRPASAPTRRILGGHPPPRAAMGYPTQRAAVPPLPHTLPEPRGQDRPVACAAPSSHGGDAF